MDFRAGILTASDKGARGEREDQSGQAIREIVEALGGRVTVYEVVPDDRAVIEARLRKWCDQQVVDLLVTTGGTGLAPRDVTPDATLAVIDRQAPGFAEVMRAESLKKTPHAMLSRAVAGTRGFTLILNLPGSPKAVRECLAAVQAALPHAIETLQGAAAECAARPELQRPG